MDTNLLKINLSDLRVLSGKFLIESGNMHYAEIHIEGHLDSHWREWLGDLCIVHSEQDETILTGYFTDQAALYGLIAKLRDLGVKLISVNVQEAPC